MAPRYQRFFIILFLLLAFAGRIVVYATPVTQVAKEVIKKNSTDETDKSASEKQNQLEEKVKLTDLDLNKILNFEFSNFNTANQHSFSGNFILAYCHLQVPEQPPK